MGIRVDIGGYRFEAESYTVMEDSTPLAAGDSSGSVGTISFTIPVPDPDLPMVQDTGMKLVRDYGPEMLIDLPIRLSDTRRGFTLGLVSETGGSYTQGVITVEAQARLGLLNIYGVRAQPYVGTLGGAFEYYLALAEVSEDFFIDPAIASRPVILPGWTGELWYYLKQLAVAQDCEVSLVSGVILLRPIRTRIATRGRDLERGRATRTDALAQAVEVYQYNNRAITDELVYPAGGWSPEVEVLNVNAGETTEYTLQLSASLTSIEPPTMMTFVAESEESASVYTVVANDGLVVSPAAWSAYGGQVQVTLNPDTTSLNVRLVGPVGLPTTSGTEAASNFSIALASDTTGSRYSTLRILGTGVAFTKVKKRIRTGVPASRTGTDVGVTIDNPFISTVDDLYRAGTRAAKRFSGQVPKLSGAVMAINRRGDSGQAVYPTYGDVQATLDAELGTPTYGDVQTYYVTTQGLTTYEDIREYWFATIQDSEVNQVFGNVAGARIWDKRSRRYYRIRSGNVSEGRISFEADDDLTNEDMETFHDSRTYGDVQTILAGLTYKQEQLLGLYDGS